MKKRILYLMIFAIVLCIVPFMRVKADYTGKIINTSPCQLYKDTTGRNATGSCMYADTTFKKLTVGPYWVDVGEGITVITSKPSVKPPTSGYGSECKSEFLWTASPYGGKTYYGYVCKDQIWDGSIPDNVAKEINAFPESYRQGLAAMKISHPKWKFVPINTGLNWNDALNGQNYSGKALMQVTGSVNNQGYLSTAEADYNYKTDKFIAHDGSSWYQARKETIGYMMDPRNSLTDMYIFQFETLAYIEDSNHLKTIQTMLNGQYMYKFSSYFLDAGKSAKVNPVYLASLSKQEVGGKNANTAISGASFTYGGKKYSGLYNFYNIGATSSSNPVYLGLIYANGGANGTETSYSRPWKSEKIAILGGAQFIANRYIKYGQSTSYFKKWNVVHNYAESQGLTTNRLYTNQYMTNIEAPRSEARSTYNSYKSLGTLDDDFTFYIPVYNNMPSKTSLPSKGNPNNYLKTLTLAYNNESAKTISGFENGETTTYEFRVNSSIQKVNIAGTTVNSNATVSGLGSKNLSAGTNKFNVVVTAQNGEKRTYSITIIKDGGTNNTSNINSNSNTTSNSNSNVTSNKPSNKTSNVTSNTNSNSNNNTPEITVDEVIKKSSLHIDGDYITGLNFSTNVASIGNSINKVDSSTTVVIKKGNNTITSGNLSTGMTATITRKNKSKTYTIVLYGDLNGDSKVNALDLLKVQKHIIGSTKLNGSALKSADTNKDGKINALDLLKIQKQILGVSVISQE